MANYQFPQGGLPHQNQLLTDRAIFTEAYAVLPKGTMRDIVTSYLPFWEKTRLWIIARPLSGFAESFSHYLMEVEPQGGSENPDQDNEAQSVLFITQGEGELVVEDTAYALKKGGYAYIPSGTKWQLKNRAFENLQFHWLRKHYEKIEGLDKPDILIANEAEIAAIPMPETHGAWATKRFVDPMDLRHDMHVNIVEFAPGGVIPFMETHVMEHGLYVLEGKAVYRLNNDWVEVEAGDYMWLRAFCPQACYAGGTEPFRYLLYKDVNRHMGLKPLFR